MSKTTNELRADYATLRGYWVELTGQPADRFEAVVRQRTVVTPILSLLPLGPEHFPLVGKGTPREWVRRAELVVDAELRIREVLRARV